MAYSTHSVDSNLDFRSQKSYIPPLNNLQVYHLSGLRGLL